MAFKQIQDLSADVTISLGGTNRKTGKKNPVSVEGYYLGSRTVADQKKKDGKSYIYFFQTATGNLGVWGKTDIDRKMGAVTPGNMTRISFDKMLKTPNGEMYKYRVEQDSDNTIEVDTPSVTASAEYEEDVAEGLGSFEEEESFEDAGQLAALKAQERSAKLKDILNRKKV